MYSIKFTKENIKFCLSLHYNGADSYLFVNGTKIIKFKAKDSDIIPIILCQETSPNNFLKTTQKRQD